MNTINALIVETTSGKYLQVYCLEADTLSGQCRDSCLRLYKYRSLDLSRQYLYFKVTLNQEKKDKL